MAGRGRDIFAGGDGGGEAVHCCGAGPGFLWAEGCCAGGCIAPDGGGSEAVCGSGGLPRSCGRRMGWRLSSRNRYLSAEERRQAPVLSRALRAVQNQGPRLGERSSAALVAEAEDGDFERPAVRADYIACCGLGYAFAGRELLRRGRCLRWRRLSERRGLSIILLLARRTVNPFISLALRDRDPRLSGYEEQDTRLNGRVLLPGL